MNPVSVVVSVPVTDLERTLRFYREGFGLDLPGIDEGIILVELPNLSLFLIERQQYDAYAVNGGVAKPGGPVAGACIFSCAMGSKKEIDRTIDRAVHAGGTSTAAQDRDGSYIGYVSDPDGHLWELVWNARTEAAAG